ncbi:MAG: sugar ABC transporter permease [Rhodospirillaceae bacterium]|nr:sugar ABC transporter permease [Rhodospirillaceae bacterium]|tara:strand:+ start:212 stop:1057 length:846 start_codon:yes stop_codon:yes gene_type:complete
MRRFEAFLKRTGLYTVVVGLAIFAAFPFYWMLLTTFKTEIDLYNPSNVPYLFNEPPTMKHVEYLFNNTLFAQWLLNTLIIGACVVIITLLLAVPAGYALSRLLGRAAETTSIGIFLTYLVPPSLLFIPLSAVISRLGLSDTYWALVLVYPTFTVPFCTWLMMGFFRSIPKGIEEAALVDGQTRLGAFVRVVLPLSISGMLTVIVFSFTLSMQEYVYALTFVSSVASKPMTLGVSTDLIRGDIFFWGSLMAGALIASVPVAIIYNMFLDRFLLGITGGAIKG